MNIRAAKPNELDIIYSMYEYRVRWFEEHNIQQWSKYLTNHPKEEFAKIIQNQEYYVVVDDEKIIGGFVLSFNSKYWHEQDQRAIYFYRVITIQSDVGKYIFDFCRQYCIEHNYKFLRSFCLANNEKLLETYKKHNIYQVGTYNTQYNQYALIEMKL